MTLQEKDILYTIFTNNCSTQRELAEATGYSLGVVNKGLKGLKEEGYINEENAISEYGEKYFMKNRPINAVILAAGLGMRMGSFDEDRPTSLLSINEEIIIERLIKQLIEIGIKKIYVIVGFKKEKFEYLIDKYGVKLIVNSEYQIKNNLHSLKKASENIGNTYIIPSDIYAYENPFAEYEPHSWYMISDELTDDTEVYINRKQEIVKLDNKHFGSKMIGITYLTSEDAKKVRDNIESMTKKNKYNHLFWEEALYDEKWKKMIIPGKIVNKNEVIEICSYEQILEMESNKDELRRIAINIIKKVFSVTDNEIKDIHGMKKGMTNNSFIFTCKGERYIMRIPGEGTEELINRSEEASVYMAIKDLGICDDIIYINPENGFKITKYMDNARNCSPYDFIELKECITILKKFHESKLKVNHSFDEFAVTEFYESLWEGKPSAYYDYEKTKKSVFSLREFIDAHSKEPILTHFDPNPDNFLIKEDEEGNKDIRLIDWEYAAMHDPDIDIAMMVIYNDYTREQVDWFIDTYYEGECDLETRIKIYCYISISGLLWSNWCEYKSHLGIEFGEYSLMQYRYAKEYYRLAKSEMEKL